VASSAGARHHGMWAGLEQVRVCAAKLDVHMWSVQDVGSVSSYFAPLECFDCFALIAGTTKFCCSILNALSLSPGRFSHVIYTGW
jgi:hypothetical protein